ncbi:MAG: PxKF domain-containing protein [Gaiellaceae bacterium]
MPLAGDRFDLPFQTLVDVPRVELNPDEITLELVEGDSATASFSILNTLDSGSLSLTFGEAPEGCDAPADVGWLVVPTGTITTAAGASASVEVSIDAAGLTAPDLQTAKVCVELEDGALLELPVTLQVLYPFSGFLATFDDPPALNDAHADGVQTFWFRLGGDRGLDVVSDASSRQIDCVTGEVNGSPEPAKTPSWRGLFYQSYTSRYVYPWRTTAAFKGTCRRFELTLSDGSVHAALLSFVK